MPVIVSMLSANCPAWVQGQTRVSVDSVGRASDVQCLPYPLPVAVLLMVGACCLTPLNVVACAPNMMGSNCALGTSPVIMSDVKKWLPSAQYHKDMHAIFEDRMEVTKEIVVSLISSKVGL